MNLEQHLTSAITAVLEELYQVSANENDIQLQKTRREFEGDVTLVVFPFAKIARKSPVDTGNEIGKALCDKIDLVVGYNTVQGFLNLVIADSHWLTQLSDMAAAEQYGFQEGDNLMMVEFSSPNTNKPLHLGHLRNIFLGHSVSRILEATGNKVIKTQIINDRGIHICKSMLAWQMNGNGETPESSGLKGDKLVGKYYVEFDKMMRAESEKIIQSWNEGKTDGFTEEVIAEFRKLNQAIEEKEDEKAKKAILGKIKELANNHTKVMEQAKEMLRKWEAKDPDVVRLWEMMNNWCYAGFDQTYETMGVSFDTLYYESDTYISGKDSVEDGLAKKVFYQKEDNSVWIDLSDEGLDEKLVLRGDGTAVYMTQDIGTARQRMEDYPELNGIIYTVGNEQDYHFKVLFLILEKLGYKWAKNCFHLSYGMVDLPSGKMKSREGTVVDADDLMKDVIDTAQQMTQERGHIEGMAEDEKEALYKLIGLGGLKYYLLKVDPRKRMLFNPAESVDLNGNTGPFIQYAHARISSLLRKAGDLNALDLQVPVHPSERELIKHLNDYPVILQQAGAEYSPALIANYIYELVKMYNSFYQSVSIFKEDNEAMKNMRLVLSKTVGDVIKSSMYLLGIDVPERM